VAQEVRAVQVVQVMVVTTVAVDAPEQGLARTA
jgi:hypothetical protein